MSDAPAGIPPITPRLTPPPLTPPGLTPRLTPPPLTPPGLTPRLTPPGLTPPGLTPPGLTPPGLTPPGLTPQARTPRARTPRARTPRARTPRDRTARARTPRGAERVQTVVVANFNVHAGIDGWGRPYDVVAACAGIDADVLVLEECWTPHDGVGLAAGVAEALGYEVVEHSLAAGRRAGPHPEADDRWMRTFDWRGSSHAIYLDGDRPFTGKVRASSRYHGAVAGDWGIAVLSRFPITGHEVLDLGRLERDRARRAALVVEIELPSGRLAVAGTHMTHITYGSPLHFHRLRRLLESTVGDGPAVLAGDMNMWGPPVAALLPGWRRVVRGRSWPAWRPHSQVDHILVHGAVRGLGGEVLAMAGSDHRPVRAHIVVDHTARGGDIPARADDSGIPARAGGILGRVDGSDIPARSDDSAPPGHRDWPNVVARPDEARPDEARRDAEGDR